MRQLCRMFCVVAVLMAACAVEVQAQEIRYPINYVSPSGEVTTEAGILDRLRGMRPKNRKAEPGQPAPQAGPRTEPYAPDTAPKFEAPPADGSTVPAPVAPVVDGEVTEAEMTPEQKQMLMTAITTFVSALIAAFAGSGGMSPMLMAIMNAVKGQMSTPPAAPARTRKRVAAKRK
jgi:hypothetical protein